MRRFLLVAVMCGAASVAQAADMPDLPFLRGSFTDGLTSASVNAAYLNTFPYLGVPYSGYDVPAS